MSDPHRNCVKCPFCGDKIGCFHQVRRFKYHMRIIHGVFGCDSHSLFLNALGSNSHSANQRSNVDASNSGPSIDEISTMISDAVATGVREGVRNGITAVTQQLAAFSVFDSTALDRSHSININAASKMSSHVKFDIIHGAQSAALSKLSSAGALNSSEGRSEEPIVVTDADQNVSVDPGDHSLENVMKTVELPIGENPGPSVSRFKLLLEKYGDDGPPENHEDHSSWYAAYVFNRTRLKCLGDVHLLPPHYLTLLDLKVNYIPSNNPKISVGQTSEGNEVSQKLPDSLVSDVTKGVAHQTPDGSVDEKMPPLVPSALFKTRLYSGDVIRK